MQCAKAEFGTLVTFQMFNLSSFKEFTNYFKNNFEFTEVGSGSGFALQVLCILASSVSQSNCIASLCLNGLAEN